jgi:hypothetical protein
LADGCVRELRSRPPEILFFEARVNQDVKCFSARHRLRAARVLFVADHAAYHLGPDRARAADVGDLALLNSR